MSLYSGVAWHTFPLPAGKYDPGQFTALPTPTVGAADAEEIGAKIHAKTKMDNPVLEGESRRAFCH